MVSARKPITTPTPTRGQWCNLCGCRLTRSTTRGLSAIPSTLDSAFRTPHSAIEWLAASGKGSTWSLCIKCYQERLRCATCGLHVGMQVIMLEGESRVYCRYCFEQRPRCDTCSRPVGAHYWSRRDGRKLCDRCQSTAVSDLAHAHTLYRRVRASLARRLGLSLRQPCQLKLVSRRQLHQLIDKSSLYHLDADSRGRCFGLFIREGHHRGIFVEYGLPQIVLLEVLAHEYAHAWQSENCVISPSPEVQEGFAEWVAYKLLESWGCRRRSDRMLRRDDVYGRGLKLMLQWESQGGPANVFRMVSGA